MRNVNSYNLDEKMQSCVNSASSFLLAAEICAGVATSTICSVLCASFSKSVVLDGERTIRII